MIKKDSYTWKIYGLVVVVLCIVPAFLHAQEKDFTTWASAGFKYPKIRKQSQWQSQLQ